MFPQFIQILLIKCEKLNNKMNKLEILNKPAVNKSE